MIVRCIHLPGTQSGVLIASAAAQKPIWIGGEVLELGGGVHLTVDGGGRSQAS